MPSAAVAQAPAAPVGEWLQTAVAHHRAGRLAEAQALYLQVLEADPAQADALHLMGVMASQLGQTEIALRFIGQALQAAPNHVEAHYNLGRLLFDQGSLDAAAVSLERAVALKPDYAEAHGNLGCVREAQGRLDAAAHHFRTALALDPGDAATHGNLGTVLRSQGLAAEALESYARALALRPGDVETRYNLGLAQTELGRFADAIATYRRVLADRPGHPAAYSSLLFTMLYDPATSPEALIAEHRRFADLFEAPLKAGWRAHDNAPDPERRLRIGYISADLRRHPVAHFVEPVFAHRDRAAFELFAYHTHPSADAVTERLAAQVDHWRDVPGLTDEALADAVRADGIDILVDLGGHSNANRLLAFARKPAPVQLTWLGYPFSTGLSAMDYRITDERAEPPGLTESLNSETLWRLPGPFCCYRPPDNGPEALGHLPKDDAGHITFGCFNNFTKVADAVLATWARILQRLPDARLLLEINGLGEGSYRASVQARLQRAGLPIERVILEPRTPQNQFALYRRVDIALDPFPCNGGTTTFDSLWMGVPVLSVAGRHFPSRMGRSILGFAGLPEAVAESVDEHVEQAVSLASDEPRLRRWREGLRGRVAASPLLDGPLFAARWDSALRAMWQRWCASLTRVHTRVQTHQQARA